MASLNPSGAVPSIRFLSAAQAPMEPVSSISKLPNDILSIVVNFAYANGERRLVSRQWKKMTLQPFLIENLNQAVRTLDSESIKKIADKLKANPESRNTIVKTLVNWYLDSKGQESTMSAEVIKDLMVHDPGLKGEIMDEMTARTILKSFPLNETLIDRLVVFARVTEIPLSKLAIFSILNVIEVRNMTHDNFFDYLFLKPSESMCVAPIVFESICKEIFPHEQFFAWHNRQTFEVVDRLRPLIRIMEHSLFKLALAYPEKMPNKAQKFWGLTSDSLFKYPPDLQLGNWMPEIVALKKTFNLLKLPEILDNYGTESIHHSSPAEETTVLLSSDWQRPTEPRALADSQIDEMRKFYEAEKLKKETRISDDYPDEYWCPSEEEESGYCADSASEGDERALDDRASDEEFLGG